MTREEQQHLQLLRLAGLSAVDAQEVTAWVWRGVASRKAREKLVQATRWKLHQPLDDPYDPEALVEEVLFRMEWALKVWGPRITPAVAAWLLAELTSALGRYDDNDPDNTNNQTVEELC